MDETTKEAMLKIQVASLTGGHIVETKPEKAREATAAGAVAVLAGADTESSLEQFLKGLSIHPLCGVEDYGAYSEVYDCYPEPGCFVLAEPGASVDTDRIFQVLQTEEDLAAIDEATLLVIVQNSDLLPSALARRDQVDPTTPVFSKVLHEDAAVEALRTGADGTLVPDTVDLHSVLDRWLSEQRPSTIDPADFNIGVVALQGDYRFHIESLRILASEHLPTSRPVRILPIHHVEDLERCDAAVLPGGWSNLQTLLYSKTEIDRVVQSFRDQGKPILGICAGMILAGTGYGLDTEERTLLELINVTIDNNLLNGNALEIEVTHPGPASVAGHAAFSNGPIARKLGDGVETITRLVDSKEIARLMKKGVLQPGEDCIVAARQGSVVIASYHEGPGTHDVFLAACRDRIFKGR